MFVFCTCNYVVQGHSSPKLSCLKSGNVNPGMINFDCIHAVYVNVFHHLHVCFV